MPFQPGSNNYTQGFGSNPENVEVPHYDVRAPATTDILYPVGKRWVNTIGNGEYVLTSFSTSGNITTANWALLGTTGGALNTLTGDSGGAISPSAGNITLAGTPGQITTTGSGSTITTSLIGPYTPTTYTAHGVLLGEGSSSIVATAVGTNGQVLIGSTGADPAFATVTSTGGTLTITGGAHSLNLEVADPVSLPVTVAQGGTGDTSLTAHGVLIGEGTSPVAVTAVGTTGQVLIGSTGADPAFGALGVNSGLTAHGVLLGEGNSAIVATAVGATGQVLIGNTAADPSWTGSPVLSGSLTATTVTATLGGFVSTNGNLALNTAGNKITIATGSNASVGISGAMTSGAVTVSNTSVTANSLIFVQPAVLGTVTAPQAAYVSAKSAGTSFTITSASATDTSTWIYWIIN